MQKYQMNKDTEIHTSVGSFSILVKIIITNILDNDKDIVVQVGLSRTHDFIGKSVNRSYSQEEAQIQ